VRIRPANRNDIPVMVELERASPTSAHWSLEHYESLFRSAPPELSENLILLVEDPPESESMAAFAPASLIVAYLAAHRVDRDWELQAIVVAKERRRRGVGTYLLNEFISRVRATSGSRIFLEVRESNQSARRLYNTLGFEETGLRKSYYSDPREDAILCHLKLY
jgi:[ribosomal protein S18]-alanine N-acetyltransferase